MTNEVGQVVALTLADETVWNIRASDAIAQSLVNRFSASMQLRNGGKATREPLARELLVVAGRGESGTCLDMCAPQSQASQPVVIGLPDLIDPNRLARIMIDMGLLIARDTQSRGGAWLHAALAERPGIEGVEGVLLAGPSSVGKSTASGRLPPPWRSLSDDATLVVRDAAGQYWAHPWPTWSRFFGGNGRPVLGGSWDVQYAVPLRAIFFLSQSGEDRTSPLQPAQAVALLMESVQMGSHTEDDLQERLANVNALVRAVPVFMLQLSLTGAFWTEIECVLSSGPSYPGQMPARAAGRNEKRHAESSSNGSKFFMLLNGVSMKPTLLDRDLLEVCRYGERPIRRSDVVCYRLTRNESAIVHRVVSVTPTGITTCGDNNFGRDSVLLQPGDIIGQVVAVWRQQRRRRVSSGWQWRLVRWQARLARVLNRWSSALLADAYRAICESGVFRRLTPARLQPRVLCFRDQQQTFLKLMIGKCMIGQYHLREKRWHIQRPFNLFVDETTLPQCE